MIFAGRLRVWGLAGIGGCMLAGYAGEPKQQRTAAILILKVAVS